MGYSIRLLDAPLHEFFPHNSGLKQEENPMLGHRSVRMAITNPEIPEMQIKAILDAAAELIKEGKHPKPEIEIPLVIIAPEVKAILEIAVKVAAQVKKEQGFAVPYALGTMVETPAAAIFGSEIVPALRAKVAGYDDVAPSMAPFGTNALTQTTLAISHDNRQPHPLALYPERIL